MYDDVLQAINVLETFASSASGTYPEAEAFPRDAAKTLGASREEQMPDGLRSKGVQALIDAARVITQHDIEVASSVDYAAQDLVGVVGAVEAIGELRARPDASVKYLVEVLQDNTYSDYSAGSAGEKESRAFRRANELEDAQDELAYACVEAIAKYRNDAAPALDALKAVFEHRSVDVRSVAKDVHAAIIYHTGDA